MPLKGAHKKEKQNTRKEKEHYTFPSLVGGLFGSQLQAMCDHDRKVTHAAVAPALRRATLLQGSRW